MTVASSASVFLLTTLLAAPAIGEDLLPWEAHPLASDPKAVLKAAQSVGNADSEAVVLFEDVEYRLDEEGRCDYRYRLAFRVQTEAAVKNWESVSADWAPWYQNRPELRARVITPDGIEHVLDPATVAEAGVGDDDGEIFSDRRRVRAPLPGVAAGSVVEEEIHIVDRSPLFSVGTGRRFVIGWLVPVLRTRVRVDVPESVPLKHVLREAPGFTVERRHDGGRVQLLIEAGRLEARPVPEPWMPSDQVRTPYFAFSTASSWAAVAQAYGHTVDEQIGIASMAASKAGVRREDVAVRLLKQLHREIRYTGVEFGEAAVVPRKPAEVLARSYGDCKDKAALLVSRLRAQGVAANVALLSAGYGADVDVDLPSLGVFDHAIVVLPGEPRLWIDATDESARVNELSLPDQGRLALIAAADTQELLRTPVTASGDNVLRKTREYRLTESGGARVIETTSATGSIERAYRSYYAGTKPEIRQEQRERYAKSEHGATSIVSARNSEPHDLSVPFEIRVESEAKPTEMEGATARVKIKLGSLFTRVPDEVLGDSQEGEDKARQTPFFMAEPHRIEWTYRIMPPPGFVLKRLPPADSVALGPARVEVRFDQQPDGTIGGRLSFDSGPRVLEPRAFEAFRVGLRKWRDRELTVELEDEAMALVEAGRTCEGIDRLRQAVERQPERALPRERLASALLTAGFGEAAREQARKGVALESGSSTAHRTLGWTLEHDALGRRFKKGWDRSAAEAEYRKAKELDSKNVAARMSLAILAEHDDEGVPFGEGARIEDGVREAEALRSDLDNSSLDINRLLGLMWLRRFEELERVAQTLPETSGRNELILVAAAMRRGVAAAVAEAAKLFPDAAQRRDALLHAGNSLTQLRAYPEGSALLSESVFGAEDAAVRRNRADLFTRVKRYEDLKLSEDDPRAAVIRLFIAGAEDGSGTSGATRLVDVMALSDAERAQLEERSGELRAAVQAGMRMATGGSARFTRGVVDLLVAVSSLSVDGDPEIGFRVRQKVGEAEQSIYVVRREGRCRVLGYAHQPERIAAEIWRLLDKGELSGAERWLDWLREDARRPPSDDDPLPAGAFLQLWSATGRRDLETARVATASLFLDAARAEEGIKTLTTSREGVSDERTQRAIDSALLALYGAAGRHADRAALAQRLRAVYPQSAYALAALVDALRKLGRTDEARAVCEERLRAQPNDVMALRVLAGMESGAGHYAAAETTFARLFESGRAETGDWNNRAWNALLRGSVDDAAVEWGQRAAQAKAQSHSLLHTLATLYAEKGRVKEAQQVLSQGLTLGDDEPGSADWYVVGRIAEHCGLWEVARSAYKRVAPKKDLQDTGVLAERALARLPPLPAPARASVSTK
jgi:tetratricopeptide (TPR) repeat protein